MPHPRPRRPSIAAGIAAAGAALALLVPGASAQTGTGQPMDADFAEQVREWTTRPEFLSPLVDHLPAGDAVPSPRDVLGRHVGAPRELTYYAEMLDYYRALADASPRVAMAPIGRTDEGREMMVVTIADEETVADLEPYRRDLARLADPRGLSEAEAQAVVARAKPIYVLMAGLHSGETGPPEMLMELAYRLAVEEGPLYDRIRDNLIVTLIPAAEPDGRDRYVDWYYRHLIDITDDRDRIGGPPYWGKYIFHDNNRDINYSQLSMRNLLDWYLAWHPPVMHDLHESVPFLYTFSGQAPQNPLLDPIVYGELPWFANFEMARLTGYGMPGVWTHGFVDMWSPGYLAFMASNHNGLIRFYETYGNGGATTMKRRLRTEDNTPEQARTSREWYRPSPPYEEVEWSMRNNTNYSQTAALAALELASSNPGVLLENFYRKSRNAVAEGETEPPHGFVIPAGQRDMTRVATLVDLLRVQGIEVGRAGDAVSFGDDGDGDGGGDAYPAGSYVIKGGQPYFRLAKILLGSQSFPDDSLRTYDDTGWTMGLMHGVDVVAVDDPEVLDVPVEPATEARLAGTIAGDAVSFGYAVAHYGSNHLTTLRYRLGDAPVEAAEEGFEVDGVEFPPGSFIVP
ncbi:MAG: M14 family zinc carboxypeptidase, partial [Acidobacteria bacterium]|nr:M14 family zinc carboxypeptidase [Acidobacteriota bacterium]